MTPTIYRHATPPPTAWSCFFDGTRIQLSGEEEWKYAEDLGNDEIPNICDPSDGLRLTGCERIVHVVDHLEDTLMIGCLFLARKLIYKFAVWESNSIL